MKKKILIYSENGYFTGFTNHILTPHGVEIIRINDFGELKQKIDEANFLAVILDTCVSNDFILKIMGEVKCPLIILDSLQTHISEHFNPSPVIELMSGFSIDKKNFVEIAPSTFFDIGKHCIWKNGEYTPLAIQEFKILYLLYLNINNTVSSEELISYADLTSRASLYVYINALREKVERNPGYPKIIQTKFGKGYIITDQQDSTDKKNESDEFVI
ncbi:winged helix-turn-helix domain-containing protein [Oceanobacillus sp. J11TS1]|uniref:winged helix-turn-helix domain-containing protein n=1 Tax=Oceanobacillus sp. J11TS1 TaxID=2807191 RepID=UPI001B2F6A22|nr:winged helix-turn-helix domain-containing protein [Oceanobacillus sp. J11TS1]GIO22995.1 hypothetical protein J11TS1_15760 [Oceanobacillus sp. J11TS1]